ncbi:MAG: DNA-binding protein [bacterium]
MYKKSIMVVMMLMAGRLSMGADMCSAAGEMSGKAESSFSGVVLQTTNASRYTYVQINTGKETLWAAAPAFEVKVGDRVSVEGGMLTKNFTSKVLNRKFDELYMAGAIVPAGSAGAATAAGAATLPEGHPVIAGMGTKVPVAKLAIQKPEGGKTVGEIWAGKAALSGKTVIVRAQVVKVSTKIMGMNWLHLQDGSGGEGNNDLVVTTKAEVKVGDVVTVSGPIHTDKDFGSGYKYDVIMEDAAVVAK